MPILERCFDSEMRVAGVGSHRGREGTKSKYPRESRIDARRDTRGGLAALSECIRQGTSVGRSMSVYVPPALRKTPVVDRSSSEYQRMTWRVLLRSINGLVNKVNVSNIKSIVLDLFKQDLLRGRGVLVRSLMKAQLASPTFTRVYAAVVSVVNCKLPEIGELLLKRVLHQFRRAYTRNDKVTSTCAVRFIAHLVNQQASVF